MIPFNTAYQMCCGAEPFDKVAMLEFIQHAPARELQEFILLGRDYFGISGAFNREWLDQAKISLQVRIGEDATVSANKIIQQVTAQTDALVTESRKLTTLTEDLTTQTGILVDESKKLGLLTWVLLALTAGLFVLTIGLLYGEFRRETHTVEVISNPVTVTNVPVYIVITNFAASVKDK